ATAGGPAPCRAAAAEAGGLGLPSPSPAPLAAVRAHLAPAARLANPLDLLPTGSPEEYERAIAALGADPAFDALVVIYVPPMVTRPEDVALAVARAAGTVPPEKPVLAVFLSTRGAPAILGSGPRGAVP